MMSQKNIKKNKNIYWHINISVILYTSAWGENAHMSVKRFLKTKQNKIKKELKLNVNNNVNLSKEQELKSIYGYLV